MAGQFVTFKIADATYGVPVMHVQETLGHQSRTFVPQAPRGVAGLVNLRGQVVLTLDLRPRLGLPALPAEAEPMMVVVEVDGEAISLLVDSVGEVLEVADAQFEGVPDTLDPAVRDLIVGVYKLEQGLLLALDIRAAAAVPV